MLNEEGRPAPRPRAGRPRGWTTSSIYEIPYRPLDAAPTIVRPAGLPAESSLTDVDEVVLGVIEEELFNDGAEAAINRAVQSLTSDDNYAQREKGLKTELQQVDHTSVRRHPQSLHRS